MDMEFNPFNDNHLATVSNDHTLKIWKIPEVGVKEKI